MYALSDTVLSQAESLRLNIPEGIAAAFDGTGTLTVEGVAR